MYVRVSARTLLLHLQERWPVLVLLNGFGVAVVVARTWSWLAHKSVFFSKFQPEVQRLINGIDFPLIDLLRRLIAELTVIVIYKLNCTTSLNWAIARLLFLFLWRVPWHGNEIKKINFMFNYNLGACLC